jgi:hypothetical protein
MNSVANTSQSGNVTPQQLFPNAPFTVKSISDVGFPVNAQEEEMHLIETSPTERQWMSEEEMWELKRKGIHFMDVTFHQDGFNNA